MEQVSHHNEDINITEIDVLLYSSYELMLSIY
jgi:hypothetical protein